MDGQRDLTPPSVRRPATPDADLAVSLPARQVGVADQEVHAVATDTRPGDGGARELRRYWARGAGAARWTTFTQLVALLAKYIENERERNGFAARVYHDRYGRWPGHKRGDRS